MLVKGKKRKDTVLIVLADDDLDDGSARINRVVRHNLRVKHGDIIVVHPCPDIKYVCNLELFICVQDANHVCYRPSASLSSPSQIQSKASLAHYSTFSLPHTSEKPTDQSAKVIPSQHEVVCDK